MNTDLLVEEKNGVVFALLNRPERRNAISLEIQEGLLSVCADIEKRRGQVRALVLRGRGGVFCAGGDLKMFRSVFQEGGTMSGDDIAKNNRLYGRVLCALDQVPVPVVAVVEGAAMGGGVGLACVADVTICSPATMFSLTETLWGLTPAQISAFVVKRIGAHKARLLMLTAAKLNGVEAVKVGMADHVADDVDKALAETLDAIRRCAPGANATTKDLVRRFDALPLEKFLDKAAEEFGEVVRREEAKAGITTFLKKEPAPWQ